MTKHNNYQVWIPLVVITVVVVALVVGIFVAAQPFESPYACKKSGKEYTMTVKSSGVSPENVDAKRCDVLKIVNGDSSDHTIMFGHHDHMTPYDGVTEKQLGPGESLIVSLGQVGSFHFHEDSEEVIGTFSVE